MEILVGDVLHQLHGKGVLTDKTSALLHGLAQGRARYGELDLIVVGGVGAGVAEVVKLALGDNDHVTGRQRLGGVPQRKQELTAVYAQQVVVVVAMGTDHVLAGQTAAGHPQQLYMIHGHHFLSGLTNTIP